MSAPDNHDLLRAVEDKIAMLTERMAEVGIEARQYPALHDQRAELMAKRRTLRRRAGEPGEGCGQS